MFAQVSNIIKEIHRQEKGLLAFGLIGAILNGLSTYISLFLTETLIKGAENRNEQWLVGVVTIGIGWCFISLLYLYCKRQYESRLFSCFLGFANQVATTGMNIPSPKVIDLKEKAIWTFENYGGVTYFIQYFTNCLTSLVMVIGYMIILLPRLPWLCVCLLLLYMGVMFLSGKFQRRCDKRYWNHITPLNRKFLYLTWNVSHNFECGKDIRMYDAVSMVSDQLKSMREQWRNTEADYHRDLWKNASGVDIIQIILLLSLSIIILYQDLAVAIKVLYISMLVQFLPDGTAFSRHFQCSSNGELWRIYHSVFENKFIIRTRKT